MGIAWHVGRALSFTRLIVIIAAITLLLDFAVSILIIPNEALDDWGALSSSDEFLYRRNVPWHHELKPNLQTLRHWGPYAYRFTTDQFGFRNGPCAADDPEHERSNTVFVVGDSFAEGLGVPFELSFAGLLACAYREHGMAVRNLGTIWYSPIIYYRKIAEAVRRLNLLPREILVFLDISDVHNDVIDYVEFENKVYSQRPNTIRRVKDFLKHNSMTFSLLSKAWLLYCANNLDCAHNLAPTPSTLGNWTNNQELFESWGRAGLAANERNLQKIVDQCSLWKCRISLIVYPWPQQVLAGDRESLQVKYWKAWSSSRSVRFVNAFPPFFTLPPDLAVKRYFLDGDVHFTAAGNKLLFETIWPELHPKTDGLLGPTGEDLQPD